MDLLLGVMFWHSLKSPEVHLRSKCYLEIYIFRSISYFSYMQNLIYSIYSSLEQYSRLVNRTAFSYIVDFPSNHLLQGALRFITQEDNNLTLQNHSKRPFVSSLPEAGDGYFFFYHRVSSPILLWSYCKERLLVEGYVNVLAYLVSSEPPLRDILCYKKHLLLNSIPLHNYLTDLIYSLLKLGKCIIMKAFPEM